MKKLLIILGPIVFISLSLFILLQIREKTPEKTTKTPTPSPIITIVRPSIAIQLFYVTITQDGFEPKTITIPQGSRITWTNTSNAVSSVYSASHPTHLIFPPLNLGEIAPNNTVSLGILTKGTYKYHNHLNPTQTGTIIVE